MNNCDILFISWKMRFSIVWKKCIYFQASTANRQIAKNRISTKCQKTFYVILPIFFSKNIVLVPNAKNFIFQKKNNFRLKICRIAINLNSIWINTIKEHKSYLLWQLKINFTSFNWSLSIKIRWQVQGGLKFSTFNKK